jgi:hypothetical protein
MDGDDDIDEKDDADADMDAEMGAKESVPVPLIELLASTNVMIKVHIFKRLP